jgi:hypothetical protein
MTKTPSQSPRNPNPYDRWVAPEHARFARSMRRDYIRDDFGRPIRPLKRELLVDNRPLVMKEAKDILKK